MGKIEVVDEVEGPFPIITRSVKSSLGARGMMLIVFDEEGDADFAQECHGRVTADEVIGALERLKLRILNQVDHVEVEFEPEDEEECSGS